VETSKPSPFAAGLQFAFVMDWLYVDDTPRAERAASWLAVDRSMLDELMGSDGAGVDEATERALAAVVAERRGTAPRRQARDADTLAHLLERAGDLTMDELRARVVPADERRSADDPVATLIASGRAVEFPVNGNDAPRVIAAEERARYQAAADGDRAARREILARYLALAGPVTVAEVQARYGWPPQWVERRLEDWQRAGRLVRGAFRQGIAGPEWCARPLLERARRRALAALRAEISPTELPAFAAFLQRWQHVDPRDRLDGEAGVARVVQQLEGLARPAGAWERDVLPARVTQYEPAWLSRVAGNGAVVWAGGQRPESARSAAGAALSPAALATIRFFERGTGSVWLDAPERPVLSDAAAAVRDVLARQGASFLSDVQAAAGLGLFATRDALRELVAAGLLTNDTAEALREVIRARALPLRPRRDAPDPTRWLPADYTPSGRVVQRRVNVTRLPRWRRPDLPGPAANAGWVGRWSLIASAGTLGPDLPEDEHAAAIARHWLDRYGIIARDWWRRERPPVSWRAIYRELKRMEYRGDVRRGYFVSGLGGAQFALPDAVEQLRAVRDDTSAPVVVIAAGDPANPYSLPRSPLAPKTGHDPLLRPRGAGAVLVTRRGVVMLAAEGRGRRITLAADLADADLLAAVRALVEYLARGGPAHRRRQATTLETIDGVAAISSPRAGVLRELGFRHGGLGLDYP
jgi:ATP-dependent Lhr-like helicase